MADGTNSERLRRLEEDVNQRVREAFGGLREQVAERLRRLSDEALEALESLGAGEPPAVLAAADLEPLARDAGSAAGRRAGDEIVAALAAIDRAGSQGEVLSALAREAARFAARTAVLLTRPAGAELWSAEGWEGAPSSLAFSYPEAAGWAPAEFGRGAVELTGEALAELARRLDAEAPERAVLVPLVLRDRLAAVLYADGGGEAAEPAGAPLQVLTWAASQALESLPFRQRAATPTLAGLDAGEPAREAPALWGSEGGGAAAAAAEPEPHGHVAGRAVGLAAAGIAAAGLAAAGVVRARRERAHHEEAGEPAGAAAEGAAGTGEAPADAFAAFDEIVLEEGPGPEVAAPPVPADEETAPSPAQTAAVDAGWSFEDSLALAAPPEAAAELEEEAEPPAEAETEPEEEEPSAAEVARAGFAFGPPPSVEAGLPPAAPPSVPEAAGSAAAESADETYPGFATSPPVTPLAPPVAAPPVAAPPVAAPPAAAPPAAGGGAEVAPPPDLEGPGRAFAGRGEAPADEEQARHEEARRLARLLVSEIRLYNEEEVEAGRRHGDVYERLKEDIDRSRQLYEERVDPRVREGTDYFYQELVRNLGGGDARTLGI